MTITSAVIPTIGELETFWRHMSADQRVAFVAEFELEIWAALERVADMQHEFPVTICPNRNK